MSGRRNAPVRKVHEEVHFAPLNAPYGSFPRKAQLLHLREVFRHPRLFLLGELAEVGPGVEAGVVAVVEADAHSIAADGIGAGDADLAFFCRGRRLLGAVALGLSAGAFDA